MKTLLGAFLLSAVASALAGNPPELKSPDGRVVQVALDFLLEDIAIDAHGTAVFRAVTEVENEPVEFGLQVRQAKAGKIDVQGRKEALKLMRLDVEIRSRGAPTRRLEEFLNSRLQTREPSLITGLYSGLGWEMASAPSGPMYILAGSVGIATDDQGKPVEKENFSLTLFLDLPLRRATIYFHERGGYGGSAAADVARRKWLEAAKAASAAQPSPKQR
jgi:hypothetical protein